MIFQEFDPLARKSSTMGRLPPREMDFLSTEKRELVLSFWEICVMGNLSEKMNPKLYENLGGH